MTRAKRLIFASFLLAALAILPSQAQQQRQILSTSVSAQAGARMIDRLPALQHLRLALTLSLRNQDALQSLLDHLYDPASPSYHQFLTVEQFTTQFGPSSDDYERVINFSASHGLTVVNQASNRLVLDVEGTASQAEQAFSVTMRVYQHPTEHRTYYAPDVEPSVELGIPIQGISGLNTFAPPRPMSLRHAGPGIHPNQTGSGPGGQFLGSDMRAAYAPGVSLMGTGQAVGLFEFGPYNLSDVTSYFSTIHQPLNVPIVNVLLDGVNGICGAGCDDGEEAVDIQQAISMAPGLSAVIVYEGSNDTDILNQMAVDNIAKQLSCSFGWLPADPASDDPIFMEFAAQGQNMFVASGDGGAYTPPTCTENCTVVFYPSDDARIISTGGTDLTTNGPGGTWKSEIAWVGSSGGYSPTAFPIPAYQVPVITSLNQGSTTLRNMPDLAAEANTDNYYCANGSCQGGVGGTSLAGPRWAGFLALANQQANGHPIGFLNPTIYAIGQGSHYNNDFHDIVKGNNFNPQSPDLFSAVTGYDLVTGWGSPHGQTLLSTLGPAPTGPNYALAASPNILFMKPGSTATSLISLTSLGGFNGVVNLRATVLGQPSGVTATLSPASVTGSGIATLAVATTDSTPGGNFYVVVTGTSAGLTQSVYLLLALPGFSITPEPPSLFLNQGSSASGMIKVTPINGFHSQVALSLSGLPGGVSSTLTTGAGGVSTLTLTANSSAATGFFTITITGTSGTLTQTGILTLAVSAAAGVGGAGVLVDLSGAYNVSGIYTDGTTYSTGGLDGDGYSYSANLLTPARDFSGIQFKFGPANQPDAVSGTGQPIDLPAGQYSTLRILATGLNGDQTGQVITITYIDGTTTQFTRNLSDWLTPESYPGELEAVAMPYRDAGDGTMDNRTFNLYGYSVSLNKAKTIKSLTLPNNRNVVILAATLTK